MDESNSYLIIKNVLIYSIIASISVALAEIIIFFHTGSFSILSDAIDGIGNFLVSLTVLFGLSYAFKPPDLRFNFGYYKFESLFALFASIINVIMASLVSYYTILNFYKPHKVYDTYLALIIALLSAIASFIFAFYKLKLSRKFGLLSLKADSVNSIKDSLGSIIAILGLTLTEFNFVIFDLIAALIICGLVFYVSITVLKESSLILLDACQNPELHEKIRSLIIQVPHIRDIREIKLRKIGIGILAEIVIEIDGGIEVKQLKEILKILEEMIKVNIKGITKVNLLIKY